MTFSQRLQPSVPLLMTLRQNERDLANDWLRLGAYDFIYDPLDQGEALHSVQQALLLSKWRILVAQNEQTLAHLRKRHEQYMAKQPQSPLSLDVGKLVDGSIEHIEASIHSLSKTIHLVETTLKWLDQSCIKNVDEARLRAVKGRVTGPLGGGSLFNLEGLGVQALLAPLWGESMQHGSPSGTDHTMTAQHSQKPQVPMHHCHTATIPWYLKRSGRPLPARRIGGLHKALSGTATGAGKPSLPTISRNVGKDGQAEAIRLLRRMAYRPH